MEYPIHARVQDANRKLRSILSHARNALAGRQDITSETIRDISQPLTEMEPIVSQAAALRTKDTALDAALREYAENLGKLQNALEQVRFMLLTRQAHLGASRCQLETVNRWAAAFQQTR